MSRKAKILVLRALVLASIALGAAWFIHANSISAREACMRNLKQIDAAMHHESTNVQPAITNRKAPRP